MADAAAELDEGGIKRTLKDLFAGAAGGVAQVLLGQFDYDSVYRVIFFWSLTFSRLSCRPLLQYEGIFNAVSPAFDALCRHSVQATGKIRKVADTREFAGQPFGNYCPPCAFLKTPY